MYEDICPHLGCYHPFHDHSDDTRLSRLVDATEPAFDHIASILAEMAGSGIDFTPEIVQAAVKLGRRKYKLEQSSYEIAPAVRREVMQGPLVYYIRRGNLLKIGTTRRIRDRMNNLMPDEILALEPGGETLEQQRHEQFAALRVDARGEYFFPGAALQRHISAVRREHGAPPAWLPHLKGASRAWARDVEETDRLV
ncbi:GIY-YIG nuclease family protein [Streptomyces scabiei]|uniref:GIY-YIG nuclease family protein n=1 Tax=Streptomyces scabiei TaxID=1930 RepID=UPI0038F5ECA3